MIPEESARGSEYKFYIVHEKSVPPSLQLRQFYDRNTLLYRTFIDVVEVTVSDFDSDRKIRYETREIGTNRGEHAAKIQRPS